MRTINPKSIQYINIKEWHENKETGMKIPVEMVFFLDCGVKFHIRAKKEFVVKQLDIIEMRYECLNKFKWVSEGFIDEYITLRDTDFEFINITKI